MTLLDLLALLRVTRSIMAFALKPNESLRKGIRRIARNEMEYAHKQVVGKPNGSRDEAVHEVRKCGKKLRALLRLVRPAIGNRNYQCENTAFRDAARPLTEVRDAKVLIETLDKLVKHFADQVRGQPFTTIRKQLMVHHREVRKHVLDDKQAFAAVTTAVREALERLNDWADIPDQWSAIGNGVQQVYKQARRAFKEVTSEATVTTLHEWRKQVKYLRYQLEILRTLWPEEIEPLAGQTAHLGELLGDDHDLAVLRQTLTDDPARFGDEKALEMLFALIDRRRKELQEEGMQLGSQLFQDSPKAFVRRLHSYWTEWRKLGPRESGQATHA
jgi:CHAD domain-containing protein